MLSLEDEEEILLINRNIETGSIFCVDKKLINVIILGLSLMLIFTAFRTCSMIEVCIVYAITTNLYAYVFVCICCIKKYITQFYALL